MPGPPSSIYLGPWRIDVTDRHGAGPLPASKASLARAAARALDAAGAPSPGSVGLILSDDAELAQLNESHMGHEGTTDVLSFPLLAPELFPPHPRGATPARGATQARGAPPAHSAEHAHSDEHAHRLGATADAPQPDPGRPPEDPPRFVLPAGTRTHLGDIVVSVERAIEQAVEGRGGQTGTIRWEPADELRLLVTHGTLHLCGWDHADPVEGEAMRALEQRLLAIE